MFRLIFFIPSSHILIKLSHPAVTIRFLSALEESAEVGSQQRLPIYEHGAQLIEFTPPL